MTTPLQLKETSGRAEEADTLLLNSRSAEDMEAELQRLCTALRTGGAAEQLAAARKLREFGGPAVAPLTQALLEGSRDLRAAAIDSLAAIGDPRAVPALTEALRRCMVGRTAQRHRVWARLNAQAGGVSVLLVVVDQWCRMIQRPELVSKWLVLTWVCLLIISFVSERWATRREDQRATIAEALARIAETGGGREARSSLPDLEAIARTNWGQSTAVRAKIREALRVIRAVPDQVPHPIPAQAPVNSESDRPIPAAPLCRADADLPRPASPVGSSEQC